MKKESKQPKTSISVTKRVFSVIAVIAILASIVCISAINQLEQPIGVGSYTILSDSGLPTITLTVNSGYAYATVNMETGGYTYVYVMNDNNNGNITYSVTPANNSTSYNIVVDDVTYYYTKYSIGKWGNYWITDSTCSVPHYAANENFAINKLIEMYQDDHGGGGETSSAVALNISLPAGNVAIIEMGTGSNPVTLTTTTADPYPAPNSNINGKAILETDTLPSVVSSSMEGANFITWGGTGGTTINGWYYTWKNSFDSVFDYHKYMIVINPLYGISSGGTVANSRIDISVSKAVTYQIVPLDTAITSEGLVGNDSGVVYDGSYDPDTGEWSLVDEDGNPVEPTVGGGNIIQGTADNIHDFLENIANDISGFFTGAIGAINTLVNAVSNFTGTLKALYIWLPSPVYSVLTSAIILAITIGVIKVFI